MKTKIKGTYNIIMPIAVSIMISLAVYHIGILVIGEMLMNEKIKEMNEIYLNVITGFSILFGSVIASRLYHVKNISLTIAETFIYMLIIYCESVIIFDGYMRKPLNFVLAGAIATGISIIIIRRSKCKRINKRKKNW